MKVRFESPYGTFNCVARFANYQADKSVAIQLVDEADGESVTTATVCMKGNGYTPPAGHIVVKDWSENMGMVESLVEAGVIEPEATDVVPSGFVMARVFKLTPVAMVEAQKAA